MEKEAKVKKVIPEGYKKTEIGVIPDDWDILRLDETSKVIDSLHQTPNFIEDGFAMVRVVDIKSGTLNLEGALRVDEKIFKEYIKNYQPKQGDIVLSRVGSYGISSFVDTNELFCMGQNTVVIVPYVGNKYLYYVLNSNIIRKQIEEGSFGSGYKSLSLKNIKELKLQLPKIRSEQIAIASVLFDTDALIEKLEELIAKKKAIKKGAMQELLTGKKRLPGFSGEWGEESFDEVMFRINAKEHQVQTSDYQKTGKYPVVDQGKDLVIGYSDREEKSIQCPKGGVIVFGDHTCIVKFVDFDFVVGADGTQILVAKSGHCTRFYAFRLMYHGISTTGYNRHFKFLKERTFFSPDLKEQTAIATILSDVDSEIEKLKQKRDKYIMLKQGMMQQLLTGRIRIYDSN